MKRTIFTTCLAIAIISVLAFSALQTFADSEHRVILETDSGYIYSNIPQYFAETSSNSYGNIEHNAYARIFLDGMLVSENIGSKGLTSYAYTTHSPAMPGYNYSTGHGYIIGD